jgi:hypothetical protein
MPFTSKRDRPQFSWVVDLTRLTVVLVLARRDHFEERLGSDEN